MMMMMMTMIFAVFGECGGGGDGLGLELRVPPGVAPYPLNTQAKDQPGDNFDDEEVGHIEKVGWCTYLFNHSCKLQLVCFTCVKAFAFQSPNIGPFEAQYKR